MRSNGVHIGERIAWADAQSFGLFGVDRFRHLYVVGQTGTGKSTLLRHLLSQDIGAGEGCALLDPHGDLATELLAEIPGHRVDDAIIFDPSDMAAPIAFNPFYRVPMDERALVASNLISAFKYIWADTWGPRLEYILLNTCLALLDAPDQFRPTFLAIPRLLVDGGYRRAVVATVRDPGAKRFFEQEFNRWPERQVAEALSPVQNKIGQLIAMPAVRNVLCQWRPTIVLERVMAERRVLIVRLPKGALGEEPSRLVGAFVVSGFLQAAMRRPATNRTAFHLYVDEFQNFTTSAFETILSEARKFSLSLSIAHQYLDQIPPEIRTAVFGNIGSMVSFRVGARDAATLSEEFGRYNPGTYQGLGRGSVIARLTQEGIATQAFQGRTVRRSVPVGLASQVLAQSKRRYSRPRVMVEERIARWLQSRN